MGGCNGWGTQEHKEAYWVSESTHLSCLVSAQGILGKLVGSLCSWHHCIPAGATECGYSHSPSL